MLTLEQTLLIDRLDAYIDYCESQGYEKPNYSTYFISWADQITFDELARTNVIHNLGLPILGNKYKQLSLLCLCIPKNDQVDFDAAVAGI